MRDCDFIPTIYHETQVLRRAVRMRVAFVLVMFVLMGIWAIAHHQRLSASGAMLAEIALQREQLKIHRAKKEVMALEESRLQDRQVLIDQLSDQANVLVVCSAMSRCMPESVVITKLSIHASSVGSILGMAGEKSDGRAKSVQAAPSIAVENVVELRPRLELVGIAASPPEIIQFAASLEKSPLFDRVYMEVKEPAQWGGRRAEQFELVCEIVAQSKDDA